MTPSLWLVVFETMIENPSNLFENWLSPSVKTIYLNHLILSKIIIYEYSFVYVYILFIHLMQREI